MNSCHYCQCTPQLPFIINCTNCTDSFCTKCVQLLLSKQSQQSKQPLEQFSSLKCKQNWLCFACSKKCPCKICKGFGLSMIQKTILNRKQKLQQRRDPNQYKQMFHMLGIYNGKDYQSLNIFQREYFMNKAILYCKNKQKSSLPILKPLVQVKDIIQIQSDNQQVKQQSINQKPNSIQSQNLQQNAQQNPINQPLKLVQKSQLSLLVIDIQDSQLQEKIQEEVNLGQKQMVNQNQQQGQILYQAKQNNL